MDTRVSLQWIVKLFTFMAGFNFLIVSQKSIIHSDSDKNGIT